MKIVLNEQQAAYLLKEEQMVSLLSEALNASQSLDSMKQKIKRALSAGVAAASILAAINSLDIPRNQKAALASEVTEASVNDTLYQKKVDAVTAYMEYALKNQGFSMDSTKLKPETLVNASINGSFDLPFLMAAAHQESCFGATPRAQRTNSVFSVGSYDNGVNAVTYADPNDSVDGYINLLNNHYLVDGKTIQDLMQPGCFVNELGKRYASDKKYEGKIKSIRNRIVSMYPELG